MYSIVEIETWVAKNLSEDASSAKYQEADECPDIYSASPAKIFSCPAIGVDFYSLGDGRHAAVAWRNGENFAQAIVQDLPEWASANEDEVGHGSLMDYASGEYIRLATAAERADSLDAAEHDGGAGVIDVDGVRCYVVD